MGMFFILVKNITKIDIISFSERGDLALFFSERGDLNPRYPGPKPGGLATILPSGVFYISGFCFMRQQDFSATFQWSGDTE